MAHKVKIADLVLRDAHQSLHATRMTTADMLPACARLDAIGYYALEAWGGRDVRFVHPLFERRPLGTPAEAQDRASQHADNDAAARAEPAGVPPLRGRRC
ncbi:MAG: hypothetical protein Pg6C_02870 [Treponemataceae bacterium]|nr:MAG: hypothetical protein Pg6C_02870 [Treponemataceae bacterium]